MLIAAKGRIMNGNYFRLMRLKLTSLACVLAILIPGAGKAAGSWLTVQNDDAAAYKLQVPEETYTGTIRMTFLGDCTLGGEEKNAKSSLGFPRVIEEQGFDFPFRGLSGLTKGDDLTLANLEVVLSDRKLKKEKKKFNFIGATEYTEILKRGSIECVTVANNHTHDYGEEGYADTKNALDEAGIAWLGTDAPAVWRSDDGLMIGFLGVNYSLTGNRFKRYEQQARLLREMGCSVLITIMHAGTEYSTNPPDNYQQQIVQRARQVGCSLVVGHHPHVIQGWDIKEGMPVVYSLGNCSFGGTTFAKDSDAMVLQAELVFEEGALSDIRLTFRPISITSDARHNNYSPKLLEGDEAERALGKLEKTTGRSAGERNGDGSATTVIHMNRGNDGNGE